MSREDELASNTSEPSGQQTFLQYVNKTFLSTVFSSISFFLLRFLHSLCVLLLLLLALLVATTSYTVPVVDMSSTESRECLYNAMQSIQLKSTTTAVSTATLYHKKSSDEYLCFCFFPSFLALFLCFAIPRYVCFIILDSIPFYYSFNFIEFSLLSAFLYVCVCTF